MYVCQHFQVCSSMKQQEQMKPNFIWISFGKVNENLGQMTKMVVMSVYGKDIIYKSSVKSDVDDLETWYTAFGTLVLPSLFK